MKPAAFLILICACFLSPLLPLDAAVAHDAKGCEARMEPGPPDLELIEARRIWAALEDFWEAAFKAKGVRFRHSKLVLFKETVTTTGCGLGYYATGPFYCPADEKTYVSFSFWQELAIKFEARGAFARAYVLSHEYGHHIQKLLGIWTTHQAHLEDEPEHVQNTMKISFELMADAIAGFWSAHEFERGKVDMADIEEGRLAAAQVGDDKVHIRLTGTVRPERFTHGTAEQRKAAFNLGFSAHTFGELDTELAHTALGSYSF